MKKNKKKIIIFVVLALIVIVFIILGGYILLKNLRNIDDKIQISENLLKPREFEDYYIENIKYEGSRPGSDENIKYFSFVIKNNSQVATEERWVDICFYTDNALHITAIPALINALQPGEFDNVNIVSGSGIENAENFSIVFRDAPPEGQ